MSVFVPPRQGPTVHSTLSLTYSQERAVASLISGSASGSGQLADYKRVVDSSFKKGPLAAAMSHASSTVIDAQDPQRPSSRWAFEVVTSPTPH